MLASLLWIPSLLVVGSQPHPQSQTADGEIDSSREGVAFFEQHIRPILVESCYECHAKDASKVRGGLFLDTRAGLRLGGDSGPAVVPGDLDASLLWSAINHQDIEMPPREKLTPDVIDDFRTWIEMGAPDPRDGVPMISALTVTEDEIESGRDWWSFQAPVEKSDAHSEQDQWSLGAIDRFVFSELQEHGLEPNRDAKAGVLLRRLHFDLVGLPPTPEELQAFGREMAKDPDRAVSDVIDRLLADPGFGERWGRHWLDLARFAESTGRELNATLPQAWRYRDWVIDAINADMPYDQFVLAQLAGDLIPADSDNEWADNLVATGFLAMGTKALRERSKRQFQADLVDEQIDATSRVFLGVSLACARCHDHKFEPFQQADYYRIAGIFNSTSTFFGTLDARPNRRASPLINLPIQGPIVDSESVGPEELLGLRTELAGLRQREDELQRERRLARRNPSPPSDMGGADMEGEDVRRAGVIEARRIGDRAARIQSRLGKLDDQGQPLAQCMGVQEATRIGDVPLLIRGEVDQIGAVVPRGLVRVLDDPEQPFAIASDSSGRLELAQWIASEDNPLTARVYVNRIWQHLMGTGLVSTPDDLGSTGALPSHPELLDHLALLLVEEGWSLKAMVKAIASSRTYRSSSGFNAQAFELDPENRLLWRGTKRRLEAEAIRDALLAVSGSLDRTRPRGSLLAAMGDQTIGRRLARPQDFNVSTLTRSVYLPVVRDALPNILDAFDFAAPDRVVGVRERTSTPQQSLYLLNDPFVLERSVEFAQRLRAAEKGLAGQIKLAFALALGRKPSSGERRDSIGLVRAIKASMQERGEDRPGIAALGTFCQALFASAEFRCLE